MRWLLLLLLLTSCGGGGGSPNPGTNVPNPGTPRAIDFTFFGQSDPAITAPFTTVYFVADWGPAGAQESIKSRQIAEMQAARARGTDRFILMTGFLQFSGECDYQGNLALAAYKGQLDALDLSRSVWMVYPKDEPDGANCSGATMAQVFKEVRNIFPQARVGVIYGDTGPTPGIDQATDVGRDKYPHGPQVISLRADQHLILVPGGADPYREDPKAFVTMAQNNPQVSLVVAFLFVDYAGGKGISDNGMLPAYRSAGCSLTLKCAAGS